MIDYRTDCSGIKKEQLQGFFVGWPNPPKLETHLKLLEKSSYIVIAVDDEKDIVIGFITAISDEILSSYIPFLEVLPEYKNRGVGQKLLGIMLDQLKDFYMIDLLCDTDLNPFYEKFNMRKANGMLIRNYDKQCGIVRPNLL